VPKVKYRDFKFSPDTLALIKRCNRIIADYTAQGFVLTLRQLYYQLVSRDIIPNRQTEYKRLGSVVNDARLAGLIDWLAIEDRTRNVERIRAWKNPAELVAAAGEAYHIDLWMGQKYRPEVWIEKDALAGVIDGVCREFDTPYLSCRGYTSQSEMWVGAMRLRETILRGQTPVIFHLGDHDPSGMDMTRDIVGRLEMFMGGTKLERLALNLDQIQKYNPPPNPAKSTDSRFQGYVAEFGDESWELDALEPSVLVKLIRQSIRKLIDKPLWNERLAVREAGKQEILNVAENWDAAVRAVKEGYYLE
jgi:hypothetical protein